MLVKVGRAGYGTYFIFGSFCFSMFFFVWFLIPETKGLSLEKMDDLFGITELAHKGDVESNTGSVHRGTRNEKPAVTIPEIEDTGANTANTGTGIEENLRKREVPKAETTTGEHIEHASAMPSTQVQSPEISMDDGRKETGLRGGAGNARALTPTKHFMGEKDKSETGSLTDQVGFYC